jgi:hypothetical protein
VEHRLDAFQITGFGQRKLQQHARSGRVLFTGSSESTFTIVDFIIAQHDASGQTGAA